MPLIPNNRTLSKIQNAFLFLSQEWITKYLLLICEKLKMNVGDIHILIYTDVCVCPVWGGM